MSTPETTSLRTEQTPFWDAPEDTRPYFMQVVGPYLNQDWQALEKISQAWVNRESGNAEAYYYLAYAKYNLNKQPEAMTHFDMVLKLHPNHPATRIAQALIAKGKGSVLATKDMDGCSVESYSQGC